MNFELARLALRRCLPLWFVIAASAVLALAACVGWAPPGEWNANASLRAGAFVREGVWTCGLLVLAPWLVHACSATIAHWRKGEVDWLAKSPLPRSAILFSTWAGNAAAAALGLAAIAVAAESAARDFAPALRVEARTLAPDVSIAGANASVKWTIAEPPRLPHGARLRVGVRTIAAPQAADVRLVALRRASDGTIRRSQTNRRVAAPTTLELGVPDGDGAIEIELARESGNAIVALDGDGVAWLAPERNAAWTSFDLALDAWLALSACCALALGLGAWLSSGLATALVATLALATWLGESARLAAWAPWGRVPQAIDLAGRGLGLAPASWPELASTAACVALGLALARIDLATWRRSA